MAKKRAEYVTNSKVVFVTLTDAQMITSYGRDTVRRLAKECGAAIKIGKTYRINIQKLLDYIQKEYAI